MEVGFCQCGCGEKTEICKRTSTRQGYAKGHPKKFISGHAIRGERNPSWKRGWKIDRKGGYKLILSPEHPHKDSHGYVPEHVLICEKALGKYLPPQAVVHHVNKNTVDNLSPFNLIVCQDNTYHLYLHQRQRAFDASDHADWLSCRYCKKYDDPINLVVRTYNNHRNAYHRVCENASQLKRKLNKKMEGECLCVS